MLKPMNYTWKPMTRAEIEKMGTESGKSKFTFLSAPYFASTYATTIYYISVYFVLNIASPLVSLRISFI